MALKPLHDRVLVKRTESEEKTAGGLIIPASPDMHPPTDLDPLALGDRCLDVHVDVFMLRVKLKLTCLITLLDALESTHNAREELWGYELTLREHERMRAVCPDVIGD